MSLERARYQIDGPTGALEIYFEPAGEHRGPTGVCCAPNPTAGGTMGHKVVHVAARSLRAAGHHSMRFNYRGVGRSDGRHGTGGEEREDVTCVLDHAGEVTNSGDSIVLIGFSFGTWVGIPAAEAHPRVDRIVALGMPLAMRDMDYAEGEGTKPLLVIQGRDDEFGDPAALRRWIDARPGPTTLVEVDSGHFFHGKLKVIESSMVDFLR